MAIPAFNKDGNLPDGVHPCDAREFSVRLVDEFPGSRTRPRNREGLFQLQDQAAGYGLNLSQWINGSFVTAKLDPGDVDVVSFCDFEQANALSQEAQQFASRILAGGESTKPAYWCHTFLVFSCPPEHRAYNLFERSRLYWRKWFGTDREGHNKGILSMVVGDPAQAPMIRP